MDEAGETSGVTPAPRQGTGGVERRALVVDDDPVLGENLAEIAEIAGLQPHVVSTARAALAHAAADPAIAVALVDVRLPDGRGADVARSLRELAPFAQVILVTGDATVESAIEAVAEGAFAYFLKPFDPKRLVESIHQAVARATLMAESERLRRDLEHSERQHREVVQAVPAFVMALDETGKVVLWNRRLEEATGFPAAEMLGRDGRHLIEGTGAANLATKEGEPRLVKWSLARVQKPGAVTYALGMDVTQEQEMQRRAMRAERLAAVGTLAAGLAHEIRNPLNAASLQLELLMRRLDKGEKSPEAIRSVAAVVQSEIRRLERLVNEFLAFARPHPLAVAPMDLGALVADVATLLAVELEAANVSFTSECDPQLPLVEGDVVRLRQVLLNLARNAIEAMPQGGTLTIRTRRQEAGMAVLEVEDTGVGITDDRAIFDAFYTTKPQGTGLGLSLVHRIIADHGGAITVKSRPGQTRFTLTLPLSG